MLNAIIKPIIRWKFTLTSRRRATSQITRAHHKYLTLDERIDKEKGARRVNVPAMPGIDEDMRPWSFFMILEHNTIVNRFITSAVQHLTCDDSSGLDDIDMKKDVMPSEGAGAEQIKLFSESIDRHVEAVASQKRLRSNKRIRHPLFGPFDAHRWHCMFAFHLQIHYRQAKWVVNHIAPE